MFCLFLVCYCVQKYLDANLIMLSDKEHTGIAIIKTGVFTSLNKCVIK